MVLPLQPQISIQDVVRCSAHGPSRGHYKRQESALTGGSQDLTKEGNASHSNPGGKGVDVVFAIAFHIRKILGKSDDYGKYRHKHGDEAAAPMRDQDLKDGTEA